MFNRHNILGKGTCLIRANTRGGTKSFDGFEILDQDILFREGLSSDSQWDGDTTQKTFRDISDQNTNTENQTLEDIVTHE